MLSTTLILKKNQDYTLIVPFISIADNYSLLASRTGYIKYLSFDGAPSSAILGTLTSAVTEFDTGGGLSGGAGYYIATIPASLLNYNRGTFVIYSTDNQAHPIVVSWQGVTFDPLTAGATPPTAAEIADAVLDEAMSGHTTSGTHGKLLNDMYTSVGSTATTVSSTATTVGTINTNVSTISSTVSTISTNVTTLINRIGSFTGSGLNTILGFLKAIMSKAAALTPSDVGGTFDNTTDSIEAIRDRGDAAYTMTDQWGVEVEEAFTTTAGVETRLIVSVHKNGLRQDVYALDPTATCALAVREHGAGSDLYTISATTVGSNGKFELTKSTPGYTTDRVYDRIFTVVISGTTRTFSIPVPVHP